MPTVARCGRGAAGFFEWHASCPTLFSKAGAAEETCVVGARQASGAQPTTGAAAAGPTPPLPGPATRPPARISGRGFFLRRDALSASSRTRRKPLTDLAETVEWKRTVAAGDSLGTARRQLCGRLSGGDGRDTMSRILVLVVSDSPAEVRVLSEIVREHSGGEAVVVGSAGRGEQALSRALSLRPHVILVHINPAKEGDMEIIPRLRGLFVDVGII